MKFEFDQNYKKVSEIVAMRKRGELIVDYSYQRKSVWGEKDWIRLIETILLNLVVPSVYFWNSETDPNSGQSILHIVDGQQRITAIEKFVNGDFKLKENYLLEDESKRLFGNKEFSQLTETERKNFWDYKLSVIEIGREVSLTSVKNMFKRLNLTDYNLKGQEKRNVIDGEFASLAKELAENDFWNNDTRELFKVNMVKRMQDIEFCANLILLYKRGIIDQTTDKAINDAYRDYATGYDSAVNDREEILKAMSIADAFITESTISFLRRSNQLYTLFSFVFYLMRNKKEVTKQQVEKYILFVGLYGKFRNEENEVFDLNEKERKLYDLVKKYKQASSEGTRKQVNRMARYDVLVQLVLSNDMENEIYMSLGQKLENK